MTAPVSVRWYKIARICHKNHAFLWQIANECNSVASEPSSETPEFTSDALELNSAPLITYATALEFSFCLSDSYEASDLNSDLTLPYYSNSVVALIVGSLLCALLV